MKRVYAVVLVSLSLLVCLFASCISRDAAERSMPQQSAQQGVCTVTFYDGQTVVSQMTVQPGSRLQDYPRQCEWRDETGSLVDIDALTVTGDMRFYAAGNVSLLTEHVRYMSEQSQQFRPDEYVTRGQAAQLFCALVEPDAAAPESADGYSDVPAGSQYYDAVRTVSALGLMCGYGDGSFRPDEPITRGELLAAACRVTGTEQVQALAFPDVTAEHWAMGSVAAAMTKGWVSGYEDGDFYPDYPATRAETAVLVNRALGRTPNKTAIDGFQKVPLYRRAPLGLGVLRHRGRVRGKRAAVLYPGRGGGREARLYPPGGSALPRQRGAEAGLFRDGLPQAGGRSGERRRVLRAAERLFSQAQRDGAAGV